MTEICRRPRSWQMVDAEFKPRPLELYHPRSELSEVAKVVLLFKTLRNPLRTSNWFRRKDFICLQNSRRIQ